jgi:hypothetical protein
MSVAQSPAHYINISKGCPSNTESFPLCFLLVLCATVAALPVVEPHCTASQTGQNTCSTAEDVFSHVRDLTCHIHNLCTFQLSVTWHYAWTSEAKDCALK